MKPIVCLLLYLSTFIGIGGVVIHPVSAQDAAADPLISLTVKDQPLGDVLTLITRDTGYRFNLDRKWKDHPVSASIGNLPLERGLKRLLRSLNHTIIWESDAVVTIMVFGKVDSRRPGADISFAAPPQTSVEEPDAPIAIEDATADEPEPVKAETQVAGADAAGGDAKKPEAGNDASSPDTGPSAQPADEAAEPNPSAVAVSPGGVKTE